MKKIIFISLLLLLNVLLISCNEESKKIETKPPTIGDYLITPKLVALNNRLFLYNEHDVNEFELGQGNYIWELTINPKTKESYFKLIPIELPTKDEKKTFTW